MRDGGVLAVRSPGQRAAGGGGTHKANKETFTAKVDADGKVHLKDKPDKLDSQDKMMLRMGIDPYARNKLAFLDRTRDQRVAIGERHSRECVIRARLRGAGAYTAAELARLNAGRRSTVMFAPYEP